jgi:hypothetical protein
MLALAVCFPHRPEHVTSIEKRGGATDTQPVLGGGGDIEARQQKARAEMQHPIYF